MTFGLTFEKLVLIGVVAALLIGPERLPRYAEALARFVTRGRDWLAGARTRVRDEMGDDFDDVDWRRLDPRQYDPRRIIREALLDDAPVAKPRTSLVDATPGSAERSASQQPSTPQRLSSGERPPFDGEAT